MQCAVNHGHKKLKAPLIFSDFMHNYVLLFTKFIQ